MKEWISDYIAAERKALDTIPVDKVAAAIEKVKEALQSAEKFNARIFTFLGLMISFMGSSYAMWQRLAQWEGVIYAAVGVDEFGGAHTNHVIANLTTALMVFTKELVTHGDL